MVRWSSRTRPAPKSTDREKRSSPCLDLTVTDNPGAAPAVPASPIAPVAAALGRNWGSRCRRRLAGRTLGPPRTDDRSCGGCSSARVRRVARTPGGRWPEARVAARPGGVIDGGVASRGGSGAQKRLEGIRLKRVRKRYGEDIDSWELAESWTGDELRARGASTPPPTCPWKRRGGWVCKR